MEISLLLPILVSSVGIFLAFKLRFFFLRHPIKTAREIGFALADRDSRRALCLALAGTLGVGNIFGVAAGIMIGGAGSLFWLLVSSFFSMVIKYSETLLTFDSESPREGMRGVIKSAFGRRGGFFASLYSILTIALALFMGSAIQAEAVIDVAEQTVKMHPIFTAVILVCLMTPCILGGAKKIESITEIIIPLTTIIYILMCFGVVLLKIDNLADVVYSVISEAVSPSAFIGGGAIIAIKEGFARGILSNEAGIGTSSLAHARAENRTPRVAGLFGICEVFFDTTLLCGLTGLTILISGISISSYETPMSLVTAAFTSTLGKFSAYLLLLLIFAFAYSTLICWYYYGSECTSRYYSRTFALFVLAFLSFIFIPVTVTPIFLLYTTDIIILMMALLTLFAIIKKKDRIA